MGNHILGLIESRAKAVEEARALLPLAKDGNWPDSETKEKYEKAFNRAHELKAMIDFEQKIDAENAEIERMNVDLRPAPNRAAQNAEAAAVSQFSDLTGRMSTAKAIAALPEGQRKIVEAVQMRAWDEYLRSGQSHVQLSPMYQAALNVTNAAQGGYLQPPTIWVNQLLQALDNAVLIRGVATTFQVDGAEGLGVVSLETDVDDFSWTTEVPSSVSEDTALAFGGRELKPNPFAKLVKASKTMLRKVPSAEALVRQRLAYKAGITEEKAFLTGSGVKQPLGLLTASGFGISTARDVSTDMASDDITALGLKSVRGTLKQGYRRGARWLLHRDGVTRVSKLMDGESQFMWSPGLQMGDPDVLLGHPVLESEYVSNTWTSGLYVGMFGDFSFYWIADSVGVSVQRLVELYAATRQDGFIFDMECDGMPVLEEAFVRIKLG